MAASCPRCLSRRIVTDAESLASLVRLQPEREHAVYRCRRCGWLFSPRDGDQDGDGPSAAPLAGTGP